MSGAQHTEESRRLMVRRRPLAATALAVALALPAAGCGGEPPVVRAQDGRVDVTLDDFLIDPQRIRAEAGRITIRATNRGRIGHSLRVMRGDREVAVIRTLLPDAAGTAEARLARGDYELVCILGNYEELGMYGTLTVR
jgi:hypothetical protein